MLQRIMLALDGSPLAEQAMPFAAALARAFDAEIILLRVVEKGGPPGNALDSFRWRLGRAEAIEYLSAMKARLRQQGIAVDIDVTSGGASDEILEMARVRDVDVVVLGSHGTGGLSQFRMASTAQKVVFGSHTSVLVVPATEEASEGPAFTSVLVSVDGSTHSDWVASVSARLARFHEADLILLHVVTAPTLIDPQGTAREAELVNELTALNSRAAERYVEGVKKRLECHDLTIQGRVEVTDDVAPTLEMHARAEDRPLVVLNARGEAGHQDAAYGSLATVMLTNAERPVLVLREPNQKERSPRRWRGAASSAPPRRASVPSW